MKKTKQQILSQFFTPVWVAEILFNEHFSHLNGTDLVWEPSCGKGNCLSAIPSHVPAIGSELDEELVPKAIENTGRNVYQGDFRTVQFDELERVTAIFGNPPFSVGVFEQFMRRAENLLKVGQKAGFIIPAYFFQTSKTFMRFARKWDVRQEILPRDMFKSEYTLSKPLLFATFTRDNHPQLIGFRLHKELIDIDALKTDIQEILNHKVKKNGSVWREVTIKAMKDAGGHATLTQLYSHIEGKRPTENPFWKDQVRKLVQQFPFERIGEAEYKLAS